MMSRLGIPANRIAERLRVNRSTDNEFDNRRIFYRTTCHYRQPSIVPAGRDTRDAEGIREN